ncbi:MAG: peptide ABC transporter [Devosia sp. 67-54]|uniref:ABC transporter permease n=1 Tax=unclassified Devosia TaxID=196773 RepID=UPI00096953E8|nr:MULTISPECIES: ABC transporter permease [unclassified Devosia]MBN9304706.1 ABC transporter permease [Devosia sp.]OJX15319.1 MAG: peptide ABC transporter [Devosia sp. 67-54]
MLRYVGLRLLSTIPVLAFVLLLAFFLLHLAPGDPAALIAGDSATPAQVEAIRAQLHLNEPLSTQLWIWLIDLAHFDLGRSVFSNLPVTQLIAQRFEPTLMLAISTTILAVLLAVPLGVIAAYRARTGIDRGVIVLAVAGYSVPVFVIGYCLIFVFAVQLHWLPVQGYKPLAEGLGGTLRSLVLPTVALALLYVGLIARVTRATMLEVLDEDYIRTARAKGALTLRVLCIHALKNAGPPIVTVIGIGFASLIGGVVVTETVFNIPGLGRLTAEAVLRRDYPLVQGMLLTFAVMLVAINLVVDLTYPLFDPRIRY